MVARGCNSGDQSIGMQLRGCISITEGTEIKGDACFCDSDDCNSQDCDPELCDCPYSDPTHCYQPDNNNGMYTIVLSKSFLRNTGNESFYCSVDTSIIECRQCQHGECAKDEEGELKICPKGEKTCLWQKSLCN